MRKEEQKDSDFEELYENSPINLVPSFSDAPSANNEKEEKLIRRTSMEQNV
jgi:hypothetical protein